MTSPAVLTRAELADLLRVSTWTIDRLARAAKIPATEYLRAYGLPHP